jgi:hypothetical protein
MGDTQLDSVSADAGARLGQAVETFLRRESRSESPVGEWQEAIWRPDPEEQRACCGEIAPAPRNKQALEAHCRTILHIASLFDVPVTDLKRAVRATRGRARLGLERSGPEPGKPLAERFFEASSTTRNEAYTALRSEAARFASVQQSLLSIGTEEPHALAALLESAGTGLERYVLALEYAAQVETAYRFAAAAFEKYRSIERFGLEGAG